MRQHLFTTYVFPATSEVDAEKYAERITNEPAETDDAVSLMHSQWTSDGEAVELFNKRMIPMRNFDDLSMNEREAYIAEGPALSTR